MGARSIVVVAALLGIGILAPSADAAPPKKSVTTSTPSASATCTATPVGNNLVLTGQARSSGLVTGGTVQCSVNGGAWTTSIPTEGGMTAGIAPVAVTAGKASATGAYTLCVHVHMAYFDLDPRNSYWDEISCV
jgi:hypothetical protein